MPPEDRSSPLADAVKGVAYPVRRLLDPRFADMARRLQSVIDAVRLESEATRTTVQAQVAGHGESMLELATHVGERMDAIDAAIARVEDRLAAIDARLAPAEHERRAVTRDDLAQAFALRWLAGARRVRCLPADGPLPGTLAALGHEVVESGSFDAAVVLDAGALAALGSPDSGVTLVVVLPTGLQEPGAVEPSAVDALLAGWDVEERIELARTGPATWQPGAPVVGQGVVAVRARRAAR